MQDYKPLYDAIVQGDWTGARKIAEQAVSDGADPWKLVTDFMTPAMDEVGRRFEGEEFFIPELLLAARAMKAALEVLRPRLAGTGARPAARVVIGTVQGDLHDIGKNLVAAMLEGAGFDVIDLGVNVPPAKFVQTVREREATIVALSALLTTTMPSMRTTIQGLKEAGLRDRVKVLVGGAPVTQRYADEIGADGYGGTAPAAVTLARKVL
jgi:5-methyltetrahydrofolate--homocysteine methyltransferase